MNYSRVPVCINLYIQGMTFISSFINPNPPSSLVHLLKMEPIINHEFVKDAWLLFARQFHLFPFVFSTCSPCENPPSTSGSRHQCLRRYSVNPKANATARISMSFFSSRRRHTRCSRDWSSDVCSSD